MKDYDIGSYGRTWAPFYDEIFPDAEESIVTLLAGYAGTPPRALELAIGTGRIALPLQSAGVDVTGIDVSEEMVAKLRSKPGGGSIEVIMGDLADVEVGERRFPLIYLPFNTLFSLDDQERQVECLRNVARALEPGGRFVLDCFVPDLGRFDQYNTRLGVSSISSPNAHAYELAIHDPVNQRVDAHQIRRLEDGSSLVLPVVLRYIWPSELDLMGQLAGLDLEARWGWYDRRPFTERSVSHVSVYRKPPA